jgi:hypothetical protein
MKQAVSLLLTALLSITSLPLGAASYKTIQPGYSTSDRACIIPAPPHGTTIYFTPRAPSCGSGYHLHDDCSFARPNIRVSPASGVTGANGCVNITVTAPNYAGSYSLIASSTYTTNLDYGYYTVKYTGAVLANYNNAYGVYQKQSDSAHANNHYYVTAREQSFLNAASYTWKTTPEYQPLFLTRISIPWGGYLDNNSTYWALSNADPHSVGVSWDIVNNLSGAQQFVLYQILTDPAYGNNCGVLGMAGQQQVTPLAAAPIWHITC